MRPISHIALKVILFKEHKKKTKELRVLLNAISSLQVLDKLAQLIFLGSQNPSLCLQATTLVYSSYPDTL